MNIGILTWSKTINHGAVLQTYAMSRFLENLGHHPVILDYIRNNANMDNAFMKKSRRAFTRIRPDKLVVRMKLPDWEKEKRKKFEEFRREKLVLGGMYFEEENLDKVVFSASLR